MLAETFDLSLARDKETHFPASTALAGPTGGPDGPRFDRLRDRTFNEFRRRFPASPAVGLLDASASSLFYADSTRAVLDEHFPNAFLIAILRNPADRALSAYRYMKARGLENLSWPDALLAEEHRASEGWPHIWHYAGSGCYSDQIARLGHWADRTLFLLYESDLKDASQLAERVSRHTGLTIRRDPKLQRRNESMEFSRRSVGRRMEWLRSLSLVQHAPAPIRDVGRRAVNSLRAPSVTGAESYDTSMLDELVGREAEAVTTLTGLPALTEWSK
jgi:hypothetical protein